MNSSVIPIETVAVMMKLLEDTEDTLQRLTGLRVKLKMEVAKQPVPEKEAAWLMLQEAICHATGLSWPAITKRNRKRPLALARQAYAWYGMRHIGGRTLKQIGRDLGGLDHTSVIHCRDTFDNLISTGNDAATLLNKQINQRINYEGKADPAGV